MIVQCADCKKYFDDTYRMTYCPHEVFLANDGSNKFRYNWDAYLSSDAPTVVVPQAFVKWNDATAN